MGQQSVNRSKMAQFHRRALELKSEADAMEDGTREKHDKYYEAYLSEREAALMFREHTELEPERSMMFLSAVGLLVCSLRDFSQAFDLITIALEGNPQPRDRRDLEDYRKIIIEAGQRQKIRNPDGDCIEKLRSKILAAIEEPTVERVKEIHNEFASVAIYAGSLKAKSDLLQRVRNMYRERVRQLESKHSLDAPE